jgi:hypothetical protein
MDDPGYLKYRIAISECLNKDSMGNFKCNPIYTAILEHVCQYHGINYYNLIKREFSLSDDVILNFCKLNDSIGTPTKYVIPGLNERVSPTSLRYIYHTCLILNYICSLNLSSVNIVEVGGGYGGLALCMNYFNTNNIIKSYTCIDLPEARQLQTAYLSKFSVNFPLQFVDSSTYGSDVEGENLFLISNYCFSEISSLHRKGYSDTLIPKVKHGFMVWNEDNMHNFGKTLVRVEDERPLTGTPNKFVYF